MAALIPIYQKSFPVYHNRRVTVTKVKTVSTSDTFTLQPGANTTNSASTRQIRGRNENQVTAVAHVQSTGVVTITTPANLVGNTVTIVSLHVDGNISTLG